MTTMSHGQMNDILILKDGALVPYTTRGMETIEEVVSYVENGYIHTFEKYGMGFGERGVSNGGSMEGIIGNSSLLREFFTYTTQIFDIHERLVVTHIHNLDHLLEDVAVRKIPTIDIYPMVRMLASVPHRHIERYEHIRSIHDHRTFSLFPSIDEGTIDLVVMVDYLSVEGRVPPLTNLSPGCMMVVIDTDYRDEYKDILYGMGKVDAMAKIIDTTTRYYKPRYQWHEMLEGDFIHVRTEYMGRRFISLYMWKEGLYDHIDRVYTLPPIIKAVSDVFPLGDNKVLPFLQNGVNYNYSVLSSLDVPTVHDAHEIYTYIRKKSKSTPPIFIDGGDIGTMILSFTKFGQVYIRTPYVDMAVTNILLYKKYKVHRSKDGVVMEGGSRRVVVGTGISPPSGCVVITTSQKEYPGCLYTIYRVPIGDRRDGRMDLDAETIYVGESNVISPGLEMLRMVAIERIRGKYEQLVVGGDFRRYLFDMVTIGQYRDILLDPIIPVTSSPLTPNSMKESILTIPDGWNEFVEMVRMRYPTYWRKNEERIVSILPFMKQDMENERKEFIRSQSAHIDLLSSSLFSYIHSEYQWFKTMSGKNVDVMVKMVNESLVITPTQELMSIIGKRELVLSTRGLNMENMNYRTLASSMIRYLSLNGTGIQGNGYKVEAFGSPGLHTPIWYSIYPDIDTTFGSSGIWTKARDVENMYFNPPFWNEAMSEMVMSMKKVLLPPQYEKYRHLVVPIV